MSGTASSLHRAAMENHYHRLHNAVPTSNHIQEPQSSSPTTEPAGQIQGVDDESADPFDMAMFAYCAATLADSDCEEEERAKARKIADKLPPQLQEALNEFLASRNQGSTANTGSPSCEDVQNYEWVPVLTPSEYETPQQSPPDPPSSVSAALTSVPGQVLVCPWKNFGATGPCGFVLPFDTQALQEHLEAHHRIREQVERMAIGKSKTEIVRCRARVDPTSEYNGCLVRSKPENMARHIILKHLACED